MRNDLGSRSRWPRVLASTIAVGIVVIGLSAVAVGVAGGLYLREVQKRDAGRPHRHQGEEIFCGYTLAWGGIAVGSAGMLHLLAGGLYLVSKRFPSPIVAVACFLDGLFWTYLMTQQRGASLFAGLALFGGLALLSFGAALAFLHPSVRRRAE